MKEKLQYIFANVNHWLSFAEAKNAALVGFNSAVVMGLLALGNIENDAIAFGLKYFLIPSFIFGALISLISFMPVLKYFKFNQNNSNDDNSGNESNDSVSNDNNNDNTNIHYFGTLKDWSIDELLSELNQSANDNNENNLPRFEKDLASQIIMNANIAWEKYRFFNVASYVTLIGFGLAVLVSIGYLLANY